ncbi:hypothetical protein TYRP_012230 [Tyrophagus putrescentiae]|nr:hypothetical protein TYRP_018396 [Tyrophagus putrescentiae]KAH9407412.1 hypothetical protein TYRP_012230 [Tyrophagus putrescentiae]
MAENFQKESGSLRRMSGVAISCRRFRHRRRRRSYRRWYCADRKLFNFPLYSGSGALSKCAHIRRMSK